MVAHQIHFRVRNLDSLDQTVSELTAAVANPGSSVLRTWRAISPDLRYADEVKPIAKFFSDLPRMKLDHEMVDLATELIERESSR